jgi:hypothetical protein
MSEAGEPGGERRIVVVLGMHRSGTSAVMGIVEDLGIELGPVLRGTRFQPRGNLEYGRLIRLHESILDRCGGSWWDPPERIELVRADRRHRDRILCDYPPGTIAVKEPRMLLLLSLWRELGPLPVGVIRNPVAVRDSLQARARELERPVELYDDGRCEALWRTYNQALLREHDAAPFPVVSFEDRGGLAAAIAAALRHHGIEPAGSARPLDGDSGDDADRDSWRADVAEPQTLELWDHLDALARGWRSGEILPTS